MKIAMYDLEGHFLEIIEGANLSQIAKSLGISSQAALYQAVIGQVNSIKNRQYREVFRNKHLLKIGDCLLTSQGNKYTPIHKYYKGNYICTYRNAHEASKKTKTNEGSISKCLANIAKSADGFEWKYAN